MPGDAVILIPGIKGTKLVDTNRADHDVIWSGIQAKLEFESIEDLTLTDPINDVYFDENRLVIIKPGEVEALAYGEFVRELDTDKPIYIFHYDWRFSAVYNGHKLGAFLDYLKNKSQASRGPKFTSFDFVTHSLGNFILRGLLKTRKDALELVNKVVFTVPPFRGSLDIVSAALVGQGRFGHTKDKTRKIIRTMPGALELLPDYEGAGHFTTGRGPRAEVDFFRAGHWQSNLTQTAGAGAAKRAAIQKFKRVLRAADEAVHTDLMDLSKLPAAVRKRMVVIVRHGSDTMQSVDVVRRPSDTGDPNNLVLLDDARLSEHGDGTVPHASSCHYWDVIDTYALTDGWFQDLGRRLNPLGDRHAFVLNDERVRRLISRFFNARGTNWNPRSPGGQVKKVTRLRLVNPQKPHLGWEALW